jgi:hypothetical protein
MSGRQDGAIVDLSYYYSGVKQEGDTWITRNPTNNATSDPRRVDPFWGTVAKIFWWPLDYVSYILVSPIYVPGAAYYLSIWYNDIIA